MIPQLWTELICLFVFMFSAPEEVYFYYDKKKLPVVSVMSKGNLEREDEERTKAIMIAKARGTIVSLRDTTKSVWKEAKNMRKTSRCRL
jgi:hypothetical protein